MKSYLFNVVVEPDEALRNIQVVMQMIVEEYLDDGKSLPRR